MYILPIHPRCQAGRAGTLACRGRRRAPARKPRAPMALTRYIDVICDIDVYMYMYMYMYIYIYTYAYTYVYVYIRTCIYMYIYKYIHIYT